MSYKITFAMKEKTLLHFATPLPMHSLPHHLPLSQSLTLSAMMGITKNFPSSNPTFL